MLQHQLCAILVNAGFPEERLSPQSFNFTGPDRNLDVVMSLLSFIFMVLVLLVYMRIACGFYGKTI